MESFLGCVLITARSIYRLPFKPASSKKLFSGNFIGLEKKMVRPQSSVKLGRRDHVFFGVGACDYGIFNEYGKQRSL